MGPYSLNPDGLSRADLVKKFRSISDKPCLAYLDRSNISVISIPKEEKESSQSSICTSSQKSSQRSMKPTEKDFTGWPEELPSRNIYDYPEREFKDPACRLHLKKECLNLYWCPRCIDKDPLPCRRFFMAKVHELYGEKASAPPSDPAVHVPVGCADGRFGRGSPPVPLPVRKKPAERSAVPDVERSEAEGTSGAKPPCQNPPEESPIEAKHGEAEFTDVERSEAEVCKPQAKPIFTFDESIPVPPPRTGAEPRFLYDEGADEDAPVVKLLDWDRLKHVVTDYCYRIRNRRQQAFEVSAILLCVLHHLKPGELRGIRWRDVKTQFIFFPDSRLQRLPYGSLTRVIFEVLGSWRTDAELNSDFIFRISERTFERITQKILGECKPSDLRKIKGGVDHSVEEFPLVKALRMCGPIGKVLRSGELFRPKEETHRYNTALEHGFAHPDKDKTRHVKHQRLSGWTGKGVDR